MKNTSYIKKILEHYINLQTNIKKELKKLDNKSDEYKDKLKVSKDYAFKIFILHIARYAEKHKLRGTTKLNLIIRDRIEKARHHLICNGTNSNIKYQECINNNYYDVNYMFYIKQCVKYIMYNNFDQLNIDFENNTINGIQYEFIPNWITYENTSRLLSLKPNYNPFYIHGPHGRHYCNKIKNIILKNK